MQEITLTPQEKRNYIKGALRNVFESSGMGAADLSAVKRLCQRLNIDEDEVQAYIANLTADGQCTAQIVGRSYYIVLTQKFYKKNGTFIHET